MRKFLVQFGVMGPDVTVSCRYKRQAIPLARVEAERMGRNVKGIPALVTEVK